MTEEEFRALIKVKNETAELTLESELVWTAAITVIGEDGKKRGYWTTSSSKELAIEEIAHQFFEMGIRNESADS
jgi:hypothetical protein